MVINSLPTDNFYKFLSLSGIAIAISSVYLYVTKLYEYKNVLLQHEDELYFIARVTQIGLVLGVLIAFFGFLFWYIRIQLPLDKQADIKNQLLAAQLKEACAKAELAEIQVKKEKALFKNHADNKDKT